MRKKLTILLAVIFAFSFVACGGAEDGNAGGDGGAPQEPSGDFQTPVFSDTKVPIEFSTLRLLASEDLRELREDIYLFLFYSDDHFPRAQVMFGGSQDTALTEGVINSILASAGEVFRYQGEPVVWSDIETMDVNGLTIYFSEITMDRGFFHGEEHVFFTDDGRLMMTSGLFVANDHLYSVSFWASPSTHPLYWPHFVELVNTIDAGQGEPGIGADIDTNQGAAGTTSITPELIGKWYWQKPDTLLLIWDDPPAPVYYIFEDYGHGFRSTTQIRWSTNNGILFICVDPNTCGEFCSCDEPWEWHYVLNGDSLELRVTSSAHMARFYPTQRIYQRD